MTFSKNNCNGLLLVVSSNAAFQLKLFCRLFGRKIHYKIIGCLQNLSNSYWLLKVYYLLVKKTSAFCTMQPFVHISSFERAVHMKRRQINYFLRLLPQSKSFFQQSETTKIPKTMNFSLEILTSYVCNFVQLKLDLNQQNTNISLNKVARSSATTIISCFVFKLPKLVLAFWLL